MTLTDKRKAQGSRERLMEVHIIHKCGKGRCVGIIFAPSWSSTMRSSRVKSECFRKYNIDSGS
jgi:hypothetical protein